MLMTRDKMDAAMALDTLMAVIHGLRKFVPTKHMSAIGSTPVPPQIGEDEYGPRVPVVPMKLNVYISEHELSPDLPETVVDSFLEGMRLEGISLEDVPTVYVECDRDGSAVKFRFTVPTLSVPPGFC